MTVLESGTAGLSRHPGVAAAAVGAGALGVAGAAQVLGTDTGPELCVFRRWLGVECPGCGGARAAHHLVEGDLASAWIDHPWVVFAAAQLALVAVVVGVFAMAGRTRPVIRSGRALAAAGVVNAVALAGLWVVRFWTGSLPGPG